MGKNRLINYVSAYLFWALALALALWFLVLVRNNVPSLIANLLIKDPNHARTLNIILDRVFILVGGLGWIVFMGLTENYFRKGVMVGSLWLRIARVFGVLLVLVFLADFSQIFQTGVQWAVLTTWLVPLLELALGAALLYLSRNLRTKPVRRTQAG